VVEQLCTSIKPWIHSPIMPKKKWKSQSEDQKWSWADLRDTEVSFSCAMHTWGNWSFFNLW
jgi:hypothetical protein